MTRFNEKSTVGFMATLIISLIFLSLPLQAHSSQPHIAHVVYITTSKACGCTLTLCQAGDRLVAEIFADAKPSFLERIDFAKNPDAARDYIRAHHLYTIPALLLLDNGDNLLGCWVGELKKAEILAKLNQYGS